MNIRTKCGRGLHIIALELLMVFAVSCMQEDFTQYVNPYIGSGGHGHVFVGANVPNGMIQAGPQNIHKGWDWCSGYHYSDSVIIGFSHTHLSGTGCTELGDVLIMPFTGDIRTTRGEQDDIRNTCSSYYTHEKETVEPGYYSLEMENGIYDEMTTTARTAIHHVIFPSTEEGHILINLREGNGNMTISSYIKKIDDFTIEGYQFSTGWSPHRKVFFAMKTNKKISSMHVYSNDDLVGMDECSARDVKAVLTFEGTPTNVSYKLALSSVDCANALKNLETELPGWNFDKVKKSAVEAWNAKLSRIAVNSADERAKTIFYTSLYHIYQAPQLYCDVDGRFRGIDDRIYEADWTNYTCLSLWDTYRGYHPLMTFLDSDMVPDIINSMLSIYEQQGKLPIWPLQGGETECMPGYSSLPVIADAYLKGIKGFDAEKAFHYMVSSANNRKQKGIPFILDKGYIPCDRFHQSVSYHMEYAVGDWAIASMAEKMGNEEIATEFNSRKLLYRQYFDKNINFIRPIMDDGSWRTPYDPFLSDHEHGDFCEGNGWHYTFFVPQEPEALINLMGGDSIFTAKLDSLFVAEGDMGEYASNDISGLIGMYAHGNEPSHHVAYMYAYAGEQWKVAEKVHYIQSHFYTDQPDGIIGNEDCGQMSAWHVLSALGFYQVNPSNGVYVFGTPTFPDVEISLTKDKTFRVIADGISDKNIYIQSAKLNGKPYEKSYILYDDIIKGGILEFKMGPTPQKNFGKRKDSRPVSVSIK